MEEGSEHTQESARGTVDSASHRTLLETLCSERQRTKNAWKEQTVDIMAMTFQDSQS